MVVITHVTSVIRHADFRGLQMEFKCIEMTGQLYANAAGS